MEDRQSGLVNTLEEWFLKASLEQITVSLAALAIGKPQGGNRFSVRA